MTEKLSKKLDRFINRQIFPLPLLMSVMAVVFGVWGLSHVDAQSAGDSLPQPQFKQERSKEEIEARRRELNARIRELEQQKREIMQQWLEKQAANSESEFREISLENAIAKYERVFERCAVKKSDRCADIMYILVSLYCDEAREEHAANPGGNAPDNSKAIDMYQQLIQEYPLFKKIPNAKKMLDTLLQLQNK